MPETYHNYIDGEWVESETGNTTTLRNPADTDDIIGEFQQSSTDDAARAIEAAAAATGHWATTPGPDRGTILRATARRLEDRTDELAETITREEGMILGEAAGEVQRAVDIFYYYAEKARDIDGTRKQSSSQDSDLYTVREPMGVVGLITPWNFPIAIPSWKMAPALATGNTVVMKPAGEAPNIVRKVFECLDEAGLPAGVANYVTGPGDEVGGTINAHEAIDVVSFTGSAQVGDMIYDIATENHKRVQTEMGSKNPAVVMPSADLDEAIEIVGAGAFRRTGQQCTATSRAIVHEDVHDAFLERIVEYAESIEVGPGFEDADMGPKVNQDELETTLEYIDIGQNEGATLAAGGNRLDVGHLADGYFVEPTVFSDVEQDMQIAQEEIFGPVLGVIPVSGFDEAIEVANDTEFGLSAGIVTQDHREANRFIDEIDFGVVKVNEQTAGIEPYVPFGGMNASSSETYREQGDTAIDFYTIIKTVYQNY